MHRIFFYIPYFHRPVYGYGVMLVIGLMVAMYVARALATRSKLDPELFANAAILALISGIAGARLSHVLENFHQYTDPRNSFGENLFNAINITEGGLTYYGGFLLATPTLIAYAIWKKVPVRLGMDIIAPCLMIGLGFGRIGCYLNGCCYGAECRVPWAAEFPYYSDAFVTQFDQNLLNAPVPVDLLELRRLDHQNLADYIAAKHLDVIQEPMDPGLFRELNVAGTLRRPESFANDPKLKALASGLTANPVHPAEIYSTIAAFLIAGFALAYFTVPHRAGRVFAAVMMIEGAFRYMLEVLRVEPAIVGRGTSHLTFLPPQSLSMVISFMLVASGLILWRAFGNYGVQRSEPKIQGGQLMPVA